MHLTTPFALSGKVKQKKMTDTNDLWELLGDMEEEDLPHVLTKLFTIYEEILERTPDDQGAKSFFEHLSRVLSQVSDCNLNRR